MRLERTQEFDRPGEVVFDFVATDHVRNHPRWDPTIRLEQVTDDPIGVGTILKRYTDREAGPMEGTMGIVAFEPGRSSTTIIHAGHLEMRAGSSSSPGEPVGAPSPCGWASPR